MPIEEANALSALERVMTNAIKRCQTKPLRVRDTFPLSWLAHRANNGPTKERGRDIQQSSSLAKERGRDTQQSSSLKKERVKGK